VFCSEFGSRGDFLPGADGAGAIDRVSCIAVDDALTDSGARRRAARLSAIQARRFRIGYDTLLAGPQAAGVTAAAGELLAALADIAPRHRFVAFTRPAACVVPEDRPNVAQVTPREAGCGALGRMFWQQARARHEVRRHDLDLYHAAAYVVPPRLGVPAVVTVYDTIALERPSLLTRTDAAYLRWALPRGTWQANRIAVPSRHVRDRVVACLGLPPGRVRVVPLGIGEAFERLSAEEVRRRLYLLPAGVPLDRPFFLCVGNVDRRKNLGTAVAALAQMAGGSQGPVLVVAGRPGNDSRALRAAARAAGLEQRVHFIGCVGAPALAALYNAASGLLYPSIEEGFGLPPLEAMACGTPALVSDAGAVKETVGDAAIVLPRDGAGAWASAMEAVLGSRGLREDLIGKGIARAARFTWKAAAERMLELYAEAVEA